MAPLRPRQVHDPERAHRLLYGVDSVVVVRSADPIMTRRQSRKKGGRLCFALTARAHRTQTRTQTHIQRTYLLAAPPIALPAVRRRHQLDGEDGVRARRIEVELGGGVAPILRPLLDEGQP